MHNKLALRRRWKGINSKSKRMSEWGQSVVTIKVPFHNCAVSMHYESLQKVLKHNEKLKLKLLWNKACCFTRSGNSRFVFSFLWQILWFLWQLKSGRAVKSQHHKLLLWLLFLCFQKTNLLLICAFFNHREQHDVLEQNWGCYCFCKIHSCASAPAHLVTYISKIFYVSSCSEPAQSALYHKIET